MNLLLKIAFRNILRQKRRSLLTCLSMTGGYVLCVLSYSLVEGSYGNAISIFTEDQTGHVQIHKADYVRRPGIHKTIDDPHGVAALLDGRADVRSYAPRAYAPALAYAGDRSTAVQVVGVDPTLEKNTSRLANKVNDNTWLDGTPDPDGYYHALVGHGVVDVLRVSPGDELILISQGADGSVANDIYIIDGTVGTRSSADRNTVFLPLPAASEFLTLGSRVHEFAIILNDIDTARASAASIQQALPELTVSPWQEIRPTFYKTMESDKKGNQFTLGIVLFIVFIGVLNTVLMSVLERTKEFGVLKAIGSRPHTIMALITLETTLLALGSLALGVVLAMPLIAWFAFRGIMLPEPVDLGGVSFQFLTGAINVQVFVIPMLIILAYAIVVSVFPGLRAARIAPVEAMRSY